MLTIRKGDDRGVADFGWLDGRHTFSFGDFHDPAWTQFRTLRVLNDDRIAVGGGFPTHPHRDMEILTWVLDGELAHQDSMGNGSTIKPGEWQYMSAGTGVAHSEFNPSTDAAAHLLQIWIVPDRKGHTPRYGQKSFAGGAPGNWTTTASPDGRDGSLAVRQDAVLKVATVRPGDRLSHTLAAGRGGFLHVATGAATVNGLPLKAGDAVAITDEEMVEVVGTADGQVLLFDLA